MICPVCSDVMHRDKAQRVLRCYTCGHRIANSKKKVEGMAEEVYRTKLLGRREALRTANGMRRNKRAVAVEIHQYKTSTYHRGGYQVIKSWAAHAYGQYPGKRRQSIDDSRPMSPKFWD